MDLDTVKCFNPADLQRKFEQKLRGLTSSHSTHLKVSMYNVIHISSILHSEGIKKIDVCYFFRFTNISFFFFFFCSVMYFSLFQFI
jgi:hypothetical protein